MGLHTSLVSSVYSECWGGIVNWDRIVKRDTRAFRKSEIAARATLGFALSFFVLLPYGEAVLG